MSLIQVQGQGQGGGHGAGAGMSFRLVAPFSDFPVGQRYISALGSATVSPSPRLGPNQLTTQIKLNDSCFECLIQDAPPETHFQTASSSPIC